MRESQEEARLAKDELSLAIAKAGARGFADRGASAMLENELGEQKRLSSQGQVSAYSIYSMAEICSLLDKKREAVRYLQTAFAQRQTEVLVIPIDPAFTSLRDEPSYKEMVARLGLPPVR